MVEFVNKLKSLWSKTNRWHRALVIFLIVELKLIPARQLGFLCRDPALSFPFTGDTITFRWLMSFCTLLPLVVMLIVERYHDADLFRRRVLRWYKDYFYGFFINLTLVQSLKIFVGSPRPHFFDTCRPEEALTCNNSEFVSSYTCTKAHWLNQSDRSFPSGHTSLALHAGLFMAYYLHRRKAGTHQRIVSTVQTLSVLAAAWCSISRMTDHRHHWWDVAAGAAIAVASLLYSIRLCKNFECSTSKRMDLRPKEDLETLLEETSKGVDDEDGPIAASSDRSSAPMVHGM